jgi:hypothetical protein
LVVRDFCFWAIWAARPVTKTKFWVTFEGVFFMFSGAEQILKNLTMNFKYANTQILIFECTT